jgi:hypothetical protein
MHIRHKTPVSKAYPRFATLPAMSAHPPFSPTICSSGKLALHQQCEALLQDHEFPAVFLGVANARQVLHQKQEGWVDVEHPERGKVNKDTGWFPLARI